MYGYVYYNKDKPKYNRNSSGLAVEIGSNLLYNRFETIKKVKGERKNEL